MLRLDDATEQGVKYQKRFYKAEERCKTLGVRVSDLQSLKKSSRYLLNTYLVCKNLP